MELKEQIKQELLDQKEEQIKKAIEENSKLKEITLYTKPNNALCENYKKFYTEQGIKFKEKDINLYFEVVSTTQTSMVPVIHVNDNYLVHGRDFLGPNQSINFLKHFASPDYVSPSIEQRLIESIKNLQWSLGKHFQGLNRQLMPITKIMNELAAEDKQEKENAKKNK